MIRVSPPPSLLIISHNSLHHFIISSSLTSHKFTITTQNFSFSAQFLPSQLINASLITCICSFFTARRKTTLLLLPSNSDNGREKLVHHVLCCWKKRIKEIIVAFKGDFVLELQQRSVEFNSVIVKHQNIRSSRGRAH
ncbi:unnamed protein product [Lupinus luteus]|uniref:Uncharacterized protein n=1 Tax=Lupinus luteus TaxID=3873 RepID=A0AAV1VQK6_LUPLU